MKTENIIFEIISSAKSVTQKGDVSQYLLEQGFFNDMTMPRSLKDRDKFLSGGNPVDVSKDFLKQNPK
jgi:hypothetical protein